MLLLTISNIFNKKEKFTNVKKEGETDGIFKLYLLMRDYNQDVHYSQLQLEDYIILSLMYLVFLIISVYSAYLSFSCTWNGAIDNLFIRLILAACAFLLGPIYLIWYFIVNFLFGACKNG